MKVSKGKWILLVLCLVIVTSMLGCAKGEEEPKSEESTSTPVATEAPKALEPVTLKIMIPGDRPADMDKVLAEAESRMKDSLNVKLDVVFIPWADLGTKTQVTLASGENVDLIFDAPWLHINQMISAGYYEPLDDLINQYGPNLLTNIPDQMWQANKYGGKIMGIPLGAYHGQGTTYMVRKDIREKLGFPEIKTYEQLVEFMYLVKEKEKNIVPFSSTGALPSMTEAQYRLNFDYDTNIRRTELGQTLLLYFKNNDGKVYNLLDTKEPKVWESILNARKLYQDGIIDPDIMAVQSGGTKFDEGKAAVITANDFTLANPADPKQEKVTFFNTEPKENISNFKQWNFISIPVASKNKERAMMFLNWANEKENYDLLAYGIQGVNYEAVGDNGYKPIGSNYPWFPYAWIWNPKLDRENMNQPESVLKLQSLLKDADFFETDILTGFSFNVESVQNEISQLNTFESKYYNPLMNGVVDPTEYFEKMKKEAGPVLEKIQKEYQRQIDEFLAKK